MTWLHVASLALFWAQANAGLADEQAWLRAKQRADNLKLSGNFVEAERVFLAAIADAETVRPTAIALGMMYNDLGNLYSEQSRWPEAQACFRKALRVWDKASGDEVRALRPRTLLYSGAAYAQAGELSKAKRLLSMANADLPHASENAVSLYTVAVLSYRLGQYATAESIGRRAAEGWRSYWRIDDGSVAVPLSVVSRALVMQHRNAEAVETARRIVALIPRAISISPLYRALILAEAADVLSLAHEPREAVGPAQAALAMAERVLGPENPALATVCDTYARVLRKLKRKSAAKEVEIRAKALHAACANCIVGMWTVDVTEMKVMRR